MPISSSVYIAWVSSFYEKSGESKSKAIKTANNILFWSHVASIPCNVLFGFVGDKIKARISYPLLALSLIISSLLMALSDDPYSGSAVLGEIIMISAYLNFNLVNGSLIYKLAGTKIVGVIISVGVIFASTSVIISSKLSGHIFAKGRDYPYWIASGVMTFYFI